MSISPVAQMVKKSACNAGDLGLIPESERSPGEGNGNPFQYFCLENPMDRGAWRATVHRVAKSRTQLKRLTSMHRWKDAQYLKCYSAVFLILPVKEAIGWIDNGPDYKSARVSSSSPGSSSCFVCNLDQASSSPLPQFSHL